MNVFVMLVGRNIIITRAKDQAQEFAAELERYGARVIVCPTIAITDPESFASLDDAINHLYGYDWLLFTSVNAVEYFLRRLGNSGHSVDELDEIRVCAIGEATGQRLVEAQIHVDVIPHEFKAEGVFAALEDFVGGPKALHGLNFLLPRAALARDFLPKALEAAGARVDVVTAYRTTLPDNSERGRIMALVAGGADCIAFTSSSAIKNLAQLFDTNDLAEILDDVVVACIGDVTASTAAEFGLTVAIVPQLATVPSLARAIAEHFS